MEWDIKQIIVGLFAQLTNHSKKSSSPLYRQEHEQGEKQEDAKVVKKMVDLDPSGKCLSPAFFLTLLLFLPLLPFIEKLCFGSKLKSFELSLALIR